MTFPRPPRAFAPLALAALLAHAAHAAPAAAPGADVVLGGTLIQRVRTAYDGRTPQQRAAQVQERLNAALGQGPIRPADITVAQLDGDWCVLFRGRRFLTVDPPAAQANRAAPQALAQEWAARLRRVLPPLTATTGKAGR